MAVTACLTATGCLTASLGHAADFQDIPQLEELARAEAQRAMPPPTALQRLQSGPIPPGIKLVRCDQTIKAERAAGVQTPGRALIELSCDGGVPWHLYVPARMITTSPVLLAAHALVAGTVLAANDIAIEQRDAVGLPMGYLGDPAIAIGLTAGRAIAGGAILTNQQLLGSQAVQRGQSVTLLADAGGISVRMPGRALSDGLVNQRIKVENQSSGKIVEGIVRSPQIVEIIF